MIIRTCLVVFACLLLTSLPAHALRDDVLVIVNDNSVDSPQVGAYYAQQRGIDPANIVHVNVPDSYFISWDDFRRLRDQLIHFMQDHTLDDPALTPAVCTDGEPPYYCKAAMDQLRAHTRIRYLVTTRGVPTRMTVAGSTLSSPSAPTSVDNYLKYWLINYFTDDVSLAFSEREISFGDGRGMRPVEPATDRELIVGRIDGLDLAAARALVDRTLAAEHQGIYGTWYGSSKFFRWRDANSGAAIYPKSGSSLLGWRYALGVWGEDRPECVDYLNASGRLAEGKAPVHCRVKFNDDPDPAAQTTQGVSYPAPGHPSSRQPHPVAALVYQGWLDGQQAVGGFGALLNWRKDEQCTVTLCADAADPAACRAASTDSLRELNTDCVGVADGFMGYNHSSYPLSYLAVWPTGWNTMGSGDVDRLAFPEVRTDSGFDDSFSLWFRNTDQVDEPRCYASRDFSLTPDQPCVDARRLVLNQTVPLATRILDVNNPPTYKFKFRYRYTDLTAAVTLNLRFFVHETGAGNAQIDYGVKTLATLAPGDSDWTSTEVEFQLDPLVQTGTSYDGIKFTLESAGAFSGELGMDAVSLQEVSEGVELAINGSFTEGHRQTASGDHASTFLNRLNGVAFWGSVSHHQSSGCAFCFNGLETLIYFLRGLPLGDAVWFNASNNSGILYGDPLYSPVAVRLNPVNDTDTLRGVVALSGSTVNGRDAAQVSTSYAIDVCAGDDFLVCDHAPGAWQSTGINGVGGAENMLLGSWDSSGVVPGSYTLRLSVTSLNTVTGRSQTLNDFYPVHVEAVIAAPPATASVQFSAAALRVAEDAAIVSVTVTRRGGIAGTVNVDYTTADGTAMAGNDYMATSGTLNFAAGVTSQSFNVVILDDTAFDGDETVNLTLLNVSGGELGNPVSAVLTITENDPNPQDSNGDGISDVDAAALGLNPNAPNGDTDGDGISDVNEVGGNITEPLDSDVDSVIDALEPGIAAGLPLDGGVSVTITTAVGEKLTHVGFAAAIGGTEGINFPFGTVSYTTTSPVGGEVTVRMRFSIDLPANLLLFKVDNAGGFIELANSVWTLVDPRTIEITLTDGDHTTDLDGATNGSIDDPVAIAVGNGAAPVVSTVSEGGGGGGCVLKPAADKDITFPMFLLASLGYLYRRRSYCRTQFSVFRD